MPGQLRVAHDEGPVPCSLCGKPAVGPCASCRSPVCGDCCELTTGGVQTRAVCLRCAGRGTSLWPGLMSVLLWIGGPLALLFGFGLLLGRCQGS